MIERMKAKAKKCLQMKVIVNVKVEIMRSNKKCLKVKMKIRKNTILIMMINAILEKLKTLKKKKNSFEKKKYSSPLQNIDGISPFDIDSLEDFFETLTIHDIKK
ncbi:hypothetical protein RFI_03223 [Reticulomyxa filosa]|uniref:Uncharacterized protein n=1 Tax=Reticulomyxa filosa TaxID=46433 RepID=X6P8C6_RETFI|nr:hypothetical protein RFI_03223 [Reticulomyxa filosa]|eukprot:ETO33872.1 hypothetical protein RFI_03223 [Reticulomyxa filosa]